MSKGPTTYGKLVRDRIPEIIENDGRRCEIETLSEELYRSCLLDKLVEEAAEARAAVPAQLATELADVLEVVDAIMAAFDLDPSAVLELQKRRREQRGGFARRVRLLWAE